MNLTTTVGVNVLQRTKPWGEAAVWRTLYQGWGCSYDVGSSLRSADTWHWHVSAASHVLWKVWCVYISFSS